MQVLRVSHSARGPVHRLRDQALTDAGVRLTLVVPSTWPEPGMSGTPPAREGNLPILRLDVERPGDVNRHRYLDARALADVLRDVGPDLLDIHEEPFSVAARQWLRAARRAGVPAVLYTAQNIDKRYPPPFAQYERTALASAVGMYPCSLQAACVARGKGFDGCIEVLPLGYDPTVFTAGTQRPDDGELLLGLVGRLVPEKGVRDAVRVLADVHRARPARLVLIGSGPELGPARRLATELGVAERLLTVPWVSAAELAGWYRRMHVVLVPSTATSRWAEQFGRVIVEGRACGTVVAGYRSGSIPEVTGGIGVLVPEGDVQALCAQTVRLVLDPERLAELRVAGLTASGDLTWEAVARRQAAFYRRALAEDSSPDGRRGPGRRAARRAAARRAAARAEFGRCAEVLGQERPFALPVLRDRPVLARALGRVIDLTGRA